MVDLRCPECLTWMQATFSKADMKELDRLQTAGREEIQCAYEDQVAELFVHSHSKSYGAHLRRDGPDRPGRYASIAGGRCSSGGTTRMTCAPSSVQSSP